MISIESQRVTLCTLNRMTNRREKLILNQSLLLAIIQFAYLIMDKIIRVVKVNLHLIRVNAPKSILQLVSLKIQVIDLRLNKV